MNSSASAASLRSQVVDSFVNNLNASATTEPMYQQNYSYGHASTTIYTDYAIVVHYNATFVELKDSYPVYEYMRVFSFNDTVAVLATNGYPEMNGTVSESLAELLFRRISSAGS